MFGYPEISECIEGILCVKLFFVQSFRIWLFILIIDPLHMAVYFLGYINRERASPSICRLSLCCLRTAILHLFSNWGTRIAATEKSKSLSSPLSSVVKMES